MVSEYRDTDFKVQSNLITGSQFVLAVSNINSRRAQHRGQARICIQAICFKYKEIKWWWWWWGGGGVQLGCKALQWGSTVDHPPQLKILWGHFTHFTQNWPVNIFGII